VQIKAATVDEYLAELPEARRAIVSKVRDVVRRNLPKGYSETTNWGMITYAIPLERYPDTYNGQPLCYAALAAQKNYYALYLMGAYSNPAGAANLREAFRKAGEKMDMGKSCLRFQRVEDLPLEAIGRLIKGTPPEKLIRSYESNRKTAGKTKPKSKTSAAAKARPKAARSRSLAL